MNAMIYIRGNRADYDSWRDQYGAAGWGYDDVLPYFRKAEGNARLGGAFHGQDGPLHVEDRRYTHELSTAFVESAVSAGLKPTDDFNGAEQEGAGLYQVTCRGGRRWSTNDAYLKPARARANLTVATGAFATPGRARRGSGQGTRPPASPSARAAPSRPSHARREVLLCGGAINSPQLLMLSGIGPGNHLAEHGIDAQGRPARRRQRTCRTTRWSPLLWYTRGITDLAQLNNLRNFAALEGAGHRPAVLERRRGGRVLRQPRRAGRAGHPDPRRAVRLLRQRPPRADQPDVHRRADAGVGGAAAARSGCARPTRPGTPRSRRRTSTTRPTSTRCSPAPAGPSRCARRARSAASSTGRGSCPTDPSDEDLVEHIRTWAQTLYHPTSTCAMGSGEDAVVDADLRVRGVDGLRVVDASVMPAVPRGNTNAPTIMVAEKAADLIASAR